MSLDPEMTAVVDHWIAAYQGDDPEAAIDLYTDEAAIAVQGRATVNGRAAIAELLHASFVRYDRSVSVRYDRAEQSGDMGYVYGRSWITLAPRDGSPPENLRGRFAVVLRRGTDGRWRIAIDIDQPSLDVDPSTPHFGAVAEG